MSKQPEPLRENFLGFRVGGARYAALQKRHLGPEGVRVTSYDGPTSAALFGATLEGGDPDARAIMRLSDDAETVVPMLDAKGKLTLWARRLLLALASDYERRLAAAIGRLAVADDPILRRAR